MEKINNKKIVVGHLVYSYPRTSIPVSSGQYDFVGLQERVVNILTGDLEFLS